MPKLEKILAMHQDETYEDLPEFLFKFIQVVKSYTNDRRVQGIALDCAKNAAKKWKLANMN